MPHFYSKTPNSLCEKTCPWNFLKGMTIHTYNPCLMIATLFFTPSWAMQIFHDFNYKSNTLNNLDLDYKFFELMAQDTCPSMFECAMINSLLEYVASIPFFWKGHVVDIFQVYMLRISYLYQFFNLLFHLLFFSYQQSISCVIFQ